MQWGAEEEEEGEEDSTEDREAGDEDSEEDHRSGEGPEEEETHSAPEVGVTGFSGLVCQEKIDWMVQEGLMWYRQYFGHITVATIYSDRLWNF